VIPDHLIEAFFRGEATEGIRFGVNAAVRVSKGPHAGANGSVISLEQLDPEPVFLIELGDGSDLLIAQSDLEEITSTSS
jgi:hypothetical protein